MAKDVCDGDKGAEALIMKSSSASHYSKHAKKYTCIKGESNPRRVDGNDPGYHYPINAMSSA
jgi:hypothetical protein